MLKRAAYWIVLLVLTRTFVAGAEDRQLTDRPPPPKPLLKVETLVSAAGPSSGRLTIQFIGAGKTWTGTRNLRVTSGLTKASSGKMQAGFSVSGFQGAINFVPSGRSLDGIKIQQEHKSWISLAIELPSSAVDRETWMAQFGTCAALFSSARLNEAPSHADAQRWDIEIDFESAAKPAAAIAQAKPTMPLNLEFQSSQIRGFLCRSDAPL